MFGNPYYNNFRENQQQPITQNFQLANNYQNEVEVKYLKDSDNPENILVYRKTLFINSNNMFVKDVNGQIIEKYEIKKIFPIDEKDIEIENLKKELEDIKKELNKNAKKNILKEDIPK